MLLRVVLVRTDYYYFFAACFGCWLLLTLCIARRFFVTLMMEAIRSSETSVLTRATWRNIPEEGIHHSHRRDNLKSYIEYSGVCRGGGGL
jgi:hypothetical protein